jgi:hypothetical protein
MSTVFVIITLLFGIFTWFFYSSLDMFLNGGESLYKNFLQSMGWLFSKKRTQYIKDMVNRFDSGYVGEYSYQEIREQNRYAEVANQVLPSRFQIIFINFIMPIIPVLIYVLLHQ